MFKSTDGGLTWAQVGGTGPLVASGTNNQNSAQADASKIYVVTLDSGLGSKITVSVFDTGLDSWASTTVSTLVVNGTLSLLPSILRSSDGNLIIASSFASLRPSGTIARCGYTIFDTAGLSFSALTPIGLIGAGNSDWQAVGIVNGTGRVHFIMVASTDLTDSVWTPQQQALSNANALGTLATIIPGTTVNGNPTASSDGTTIIFGTYEIFSTNQITVAQGASADPITFASQSISPDPGLSFIQVVRSIGTSYLFQLGFGADNTFSQATDTGSGFSASTILGHTATSISNEFFVGALPLPDTWGAVFRGSVYFWSGAFSGGGGGAVPVNMGPSGGGNFLIPGNPGGLTMILPNPPATYLCRYSQIVPCECPQGEIQYVLGKDAMWIPQ